MDNNFNSGGFGEGKDGEKRLDFYKVLRQKIKDFAESKAGKELKFIDYALVAPDLFHLLCRLTIDPDVGLSDKVKLGLAITYFISPIDFVPEALIGPAGYLDDVAVAAYVLNNMLNKIDKEIVQRNWAGEGDVLLLVQDIMKHADSMIGGGLWAKIRMVFIK